VKKRTVALLAGATAVGVAVFFGSRLVAQQPATTPLRTRIAVINLPHVIKSYTKYQAFEHEWQETYKLFDKNYEGKRNLLTQYQNEMQKQTDPATREKWEAAIRQLQREMQDMGEDAKKQLSKKRDDQAVIIYKEIEEAVQVYARSQDMDLVLHYNDAIVPQDLYSPPNIQRKLQIGALFPMYHNPQMDITTPVITMLNQRYAAMSNQPQQVQPASATAPPQQPQR